MGAQQVGIGAASRQLGLSKTSIQKLVDSGQLIATKTTAITATLASLYPALSCVVATDGMDAVLHLERQRPSILITDLSLTPFDGFGLAQMVSTRAE